MSPDEIRQVVQALVKARKVTQSALAMEAGVNPGQLSRFMRGSGPKGLSADKLAQLQAALAHFQPGDAAVLNVRHQRVLAEKLNDGQLALFVGDHLSNLCRRRDDNSARLPLWEEVVDVLCQRLELDPADYTGPLDLFEAIECERDRATLQRELREVFDDQPYVLCEAHEQLRVLPWHRVVTTTHDGLLSRLFHQQPIRHEEDYDRLSDQPRPMLFQLNGGLTVEEQLDWLSQHPRAYRDLENLLLNKTILFVGYSFSDPAITHLLRTVKKITKGREKRCYAWGWRLSDEQVRRFDRRDKIEAVSIGQNADWARAFRELSECYQALKNAPDTVLVQRDHDADPFAYDRAQYDQAMRAMHSSANLHLIYTPGPGYARSDVSLEEIFTEPDLSRTVDRKPVAEAVTKSTDAEHLKHLQEERNVEIRAASEGLRLYRRLVILGAPGQGKTTLLRHWLLQAAQNWRKDPSAHPFPVYIRLRDWETDMFSGDGRLKRYLLETLPLLSEASAKALQAWRDGPVLWLLDGLDEIRDPTERARLREEVTGLAQGRAQDHWVLTSRPAGYPLGGIGVDWVCTQLCPLTDAQINSVLAKWAVVLQEKEGLVLEYQRIARDLAGNSGLKRIRSNGLLLTLTVLYYKNNQRLPHDRWEFYDHAQKVMRESWVTHRIKNAHALLPGGYLEDLLEHLALKGMAEGKVTFLRALLEQETRAHLRRLNYSAKELDDETHRFLRAAEDLIGVLVAQAPDQFGFLHLTFQEFYAARALVHQSGEAKFYIARYWDHPDWLELWSLYFLGLKMDKLRVAELFSTILDNRHALDAQLHRPELMCYFLGGRGRQPMPEGLEVWAGIERQIIAWMKDKKQWVWSGVMDVLAGWEQDLPEAVLDCLLPEEDLPKYLDGKLAAVCVGHVHQSRVNTFVTRRVVDDDWTVRYYAITALRPLVAEQEIQALMRQGLADNNGSVRAAAIKALSPLVAEHEIQALMRQGLADDEGFVRASTIKALSPLVVEQEIQALLRQGLADDDRLVRAVAINALSPLVDEQEIQALMRQALADDHMIVRVTAINAMSPLVAEQEIQALMRKGLADDDGGVRAAAIKALSPLVAEQQIQALMRQGLVDDDERVRAAAIKALSPLVAEQEIHALLRQGLADDGDVCAAAIKALSPLVAEQEIQALMRQGLSEDNQAVRAAAINALSPLAADQEIQEELLHCPRFGHEYELVATALRNVIVKQRFERR